MAPTVFPERQAGFRAGPGGARLVSTARRTVAFAGFGSADDAWRAAGAAYDALRAWIARERRTLPIPGDRRSLRARRDDGGGLRITLGRVTVGRIARREGDDGAPTYELSLLLPPGLTARGRRSAARVVDEAIARWTALRELEQAIAAGAGPRTDPTHDAPHRDAVSGARETVHAGDAGHRPIEH